jgi:hypothetical protein
MVFTNYSLNNYSYKGIIVSATNNEVQSNVEKVNNIDFTSENIFELVDGVDGTRKFPDFTRTERGLLRGSMKVRFDTGTVIKMSLNQIINYLRKELIVPGGISHLITRSVTATNTGNVLMNVAMQIDDEMLEKAENDYIGFKNGSYFIGGRRETHVATTTSKEATVVLGVGVPSSISHAMMGAEEA